MRLILGMYCLLYSNPFILRTSCTSVQILELILLIFDLIFNNKLFTFTTLEFTEWLLNKNYPIVIDPLVFAIQVIAKLLHL